MARNDNLVMEDVRIVFRNFAGREGQYNREGDRNFSVVIEEETARAMEADGWNIKWPRPKEGLDPEEDTRLPTLPVSVGFKGRNPPRIIMIGGTSKRRTVLDEESVEVLDFVDIQTVDLTVRPYHWEVSGNKGVKAYLQNIYVTIHEDALDLKYAEEEPKPEDYESNRGDEPEWSGE